MIEIWMKNCWVVRKNCNIVMTNNVTFTSNVGDITQSVSNQCWARQIESVTLNTVFGVVSGDCVSWMTYAAGGSVVSNTEMMHLPWWLSDDVSCNDDWVLTTLVSGDCVSRISYAVGGFVVLLRKWCICHGDWILEILVFGDCVLKAV